MSRSNLAWLITVPLVLVLGLTLSLGSPTKTNEKDYKLVRTFVNAIAEIDEHFVRELSDEEKKKLVENMIDLGLQKLDPYSQYLNADQFKHFETQYDGKFGGIGVLLGTDPRSGALMVISPLEGTPAYEAGLLPGDIILKIDDHDADQIKIQDAMKLIMGDPGTEIRMTVMHEGAEKAETVTLKRAQIEVHTVHGLKRKPDHSGWDWFAAEGVGYIRLSGFNDPTIKELTAAIKRLEDEGARSLILDLRGNPGGLLTSAIEVSDLFLTEGRIVSTKNRHGNGRSWDAKGDGTMFRNRPIAVLINRDSASASEIVAAALQDNHRAVVIGERSYGKGSVQKTIRLSVDPKDPPSALKLTTEKYWRPNGKNIHREPTHKDADEWGVHPDDGGLVTLTDEERLAFLRYQRNMSIIGKNGKLPKPKDPKETKPFQDRALELAIQKLQQQMK